MVLRLLQIVVVMFVVSTLLFFLLRSSGDTVALLAGQNADAAVVDRIRTAYGFNDPLYVQYVRFISRAAQLDFGESVAAHTPAMAWSAAASPPPHC